VNFLAHIYLSGENADIQIGNFIAYAVKGNQIDQYNLFFKNGIRLLRAMDAKNKK
jgi:acyl carrier protein phosphodiesterase